MKVKYEIASAKDVPGIISLCNECFNEKTDLAYAEKVFAATASDPNQIYVNGVAGGEIIAHGKLTIIPTMYGDMATYALLNHFCVKEQYRRHHIATGLMAELVKISKAKNCKNICLWSKNFRVAAHAFYKKYGFELVEAGFFSKDI